MLVSCWSMCNNGRINIYSINDKALNTYISRGKCHFLSEYNECRIMNTDCITDCVIIDTITDRNGSFSYSEPNPRDEGEGLSIRIYVKWMFSKFLSALNYWLVIYSATSIRVLSRDSYCSSHMCQRRLLVLKNKRFL